MSNVPLAGSPLVFTDWIPGRKSLLPTFIDDEDCARIDMGFGGQWEDVACSHHHGYVCEFAGTVYMLITYKLAFP